MEISKTEFLNRLYLDNRISLASFINSLIYSNNYDDVEDCLQETFLIVIRKVKTTDISAHPNIKGWLFAIAKNVAKKFNSVYMKRKSNLTGEIDAGREDFTEQLIEDIIYDETDKNKLINDLMNEMTTREREIFLLKQKALDNKEIAAIIGKSESTVKSTYSRLKPKIINKIKEEKL